MDQPGPAVLVFNRDGDVMAFPHLDVAAGWMEAVDVLEGEYEAAYTIDGRELTIVAERDSPVSLRVTDVRDVADLRTRLARSGMHMGLSFDLSNLSAVANYLMRREWERRWPRRPRWLSRLVHGDGPPRV